MKEETKSWIVALIFIIAFIGFGILNHSMERRQRQLYDVVTTVLATTQIPTEIFAEKPETEPATEEPTTTEEVTEEPTTKAEEPTTLKVEKSTTSKVEESTSKARVPSLTLKDSSKTPLGRFKITGYTAEEGFPEGSATASGVGVGPGICAMNNTQRKELGIKYGQKIYIEGLGTYTVQDCGCPYGVVDVWVYTNAEAYAMTGYYNVYLIG